MTRYLEAQGCTDIKYTFEERPYSDIYEELQS